MHSASVNSEPGSNSPFKALGVFAGVRPDYFRLRQNEEELTLLCSCCSRTRRRSGTHTIIFLTPSLPGGRAGRPFARKNRLSKNKKFFLASCFISRSPGKLYLPLDCDSHRSRTSRILSQLRARVNNIFKKYFFRVRAAPVFSTRKPHFARAENIFKNRLTRAEPRAIFLKKLSRHASTRMLRGRRMPKHRYGRRRAFGVETGRGRSLVRRNNGLAELD